MNIQIKDKVGLCETDILKLVHSLLENRKPENGKFNYGLETHGVIGFTDGITLKYPIVVCQENKRISIKSPIIIVIKRYIL